MLEFEESPFFRVTAGDLLESFAVLGQSRSVRTITVGIMQLVLIPSTVPFQLIVIHNTSSSDIYFILSLFLSLSLSFSLSLSLLLFYFPRCFLAIFPSPFSFSVTVRLCILLISLFLSLSLPPSLSVFLICARVTVRLRRWTRKDWCCTIAQTCLTASKRLRRPCRTEGMIFLRIVRAIWGAVLTHRFTPVPGPANGSSPGPIGRPISVHRFPVPRQSKCHPSVPTCNRLHHS